MVDKIKINHNFGAIKANGVIYNVKVAGFSDATFQKFTGFDKNLLEIHINMPKTLLTMFYKANVVVLGAKINNEGPSTLKFRMCFFNAIMT